MPTITKIDFTENVGKINPALHSSGFAPVLYPRGFYTVDEELKSLNLYSARTHDWALVNHGQRIVDTHFVFPLIHADFSRLYMRIHPIPKTTISTPRMRP